MKELEGVPNIVTRALDVTQDDQIASLVAETMEAEGRIDCIVNNAGSLCIGVCRRLLFSIKSNTRPSVL